ncbi:hypothetical protein ACFPPD_06910 [Cohnella suwonensis]|uniref:Uncharacterized protein n=1 Tax=Cohnella suwonensis TaxID=696072 RepID=A0ABW0LT45_9BACL
MRRSRKQIESEAKKLIEKYGKIPFSIKEVLPDLLDDFNWDEKKAKEQAALAHARRKIASIKDAHGVRCFIAFDASSEGEQRFHLYQMVESCESPEILRRQKAELSRTLNGTQDTWIKVDARLDHLEEQAAGRGAASQ